MNQEEMRQDLERTLGLPAGTPWDKVLDTVAVVVATQPLPDFTPRMMDLQAKVTELEHLVFLDSMTFHLIVDHPDQAVKIATQALARIQKRVA